MQAHHWRSCLACAQAEQGLDDFEPPRTGAAITLAQSTKSFDPVIDASRQRIISSYAAKFSAIKSDEARIA